MIEPDHHPHAERTAEFLAAAFGPNAPQALTAVQMVLGNTQFMRVLEAFCFAHETTEDGNTSTMLLREGMRQVCLMVQSSRSLKPDDVKTE
jgi:hypothetical protein